MLGLIRFVTAALLLSWFATFSSAAEGELAPIEEAGSESTQSPDGPEVVNLFQSGDPGQPLHIHGWVRSADGTPIEGATVNIRQADGAGEYHDDRYRASLQTGKDGSYRFGTVLPGQYYGVKHIHVEVMHEDYQPLVTQILFKGDTQLDPSTQAEHGIHLEEATSKGKTVLFGRFDIVMRAAGSS